MQHNFFSLEYYMQMNSLEAWQSSVQFNSLVRRNSACFSAMLGCKFLLCNGSWVIGARRFGGTFLEMWFVSRKLQLPITKETGQKEETRDSCQFFKSFERTTVLFGVLHIWLQFVLKYGLFWTTKECFNMFRQCFCARNYWGQPFQPKKTTSTKYAQEIIYIVPAMLILVGSTERSCQLLPKKDGDNLWPVQ